MRGFKSFVDETHLKFEPGVTAIVGPNGCGKSNIADALRWVLGEQAVRYMRGQKIEDLIFDGSSKRSRSGYTEVSITISNEDRQITVSPYCEYDEIAIKRKYYRSGESEYFINKVACRLKDIVDIFLDTGVSSRSLSVLEQSQVFKIIDAKPDERRHFIEEAAGVMRYKVRRNAAINKLASSQQNLLRAQDIIGELERQKDSLKRQANKANRYKEYKDELHDKLVILYAAEHRTTLASYESANKNVKDLEASLVGKLGVIDKLKNHLEEIVVKIEEKERKHSESREKKVKFGALLEKNESYIEGLSEQINNLLIEHEESLAQRDRIKVKIEKGTEQLKFKEDQLLTFQSRFEGVAKTREELKVQVNDAKGKLGSLQDELDQSREELSNQSGEELSIKQRRSDLIARLEMTESNLASRNEELANLQETFSSNTKQLEEHDAKIAKFKIDIESAKERHSTLQSDLEQRLKEKEKNQDQLNIVQKSSSYNMARLETLEKLSENLEGYSSGAKELMKLQSSDKNLIKGLLANYLKVKNESDEDLIAFILNEKIQSLIVSDDSSLLKLSTHLKDNQYGKAILVRDYIDPNYHPKEFRLEEGDGYVASNLCQFMQGSPTPLRQVLDETIISPDLDRAFKLFKRNNEEFSVVTEDMILIDKDQFIVISGAIENDNKEIVSRRKVTDELKENLAAAEVELTKLTEENDRLDGEYNESLKLVNSSSEVIRDLEFSLSRLQQENNNQREDRSRIEGELSRIDILRSELQSDKEQIAVKIEELSEKIEAIDFESGQIEEKIDKLTLACSAARMELDGLTSSLNENEIAVTKLKGEKDSLELDITNGSSQLDELNDQGAYLASSIESNLTKRNDLATSLEDIKSDNLGYESEIELIKRELTDSMNELNSLFEQKSELTDKIKFEDREKLDLETRKESLLEDRATSTVKLETLQTNIANELKVGINDLPDDDLESIDLNQISDRTTFLKSQIERIGEVNMGSIAEYEEVKKRYDFLTDQSADLVSSIATLRKTIDNLNKKTTKLFDEAFKEVAANFEKLFTTLFAGGKASLKLSNEDLSELEPGVHIEVQPPGKKVQNINLLSAGEKAMSAIALLFAIFLRKPSPFCLLDEIDAPLDEANVYRFRDLLMSMTDKVQFIIITHNQRTMSFANRLYGVTQLEDGISSILAVDLDSNEKGKLQSYNKDLITA